MQTMLICTADIFARLVRRIVRATRVDLPLTTGTWSWQQFYYAPYVAHALLTYPIRACIEARLLRATGLYAFDPFDFQASIRDLLVCKPGFYLRLYGIHVLL